MNDSGEQKALIFNIQRYNVYDGPGVRTLVFFKACPLHCIWCANPESVQPGYDLMYKSSECTNCAACTTVCPEGIHTMENNRHEVHRDIKCTGCGKCESVCPASALSVVGEEKTISDIFRIIERDRAFYETSGGGITLSGGEALSQPQAAMSLLRKCKEEGINTALETSGYAKQETLFKVAEFVDLFLFDIKHISPKEHLEFTGVSNELILSNLRELLERGHNVHIRIPLLKGVNDGEDNIKSTIEFLKPFCNCKNFKGVDLLPYHKLGVHKHEQLGREYLYSEERPDEEVIEKIEKMFNLDGFNVRVVRH